MTPLFKEKLLALAKKLEDDTNKFFELGTGSPKFSRDRTDAEVMYIANIKYFIGFISSINDNEPKT